MRPTLSIWRTLRRSARATAISLHTRHLNEQMVKVLQTIGYDVSFTRGVGQYHLMTATAQNISIFSPVGACSRSDATIPTSGAR